MTFVHLHVHSEYSLLDGFSNLKKLVARAKDLAMPALALTDHGTMFGVVEFFNEACKAGIKPIIGLETYLAARTMHERDPQEDKKSKHCLLLAENETGYRNLLEIASAGQLEGFYYYPRIDHEFLARHSEGIICGSGCMASEIPRFIYQDNLEAARRKMDWYFEVFGRDHFFLELQSHNIPGLDQVNKTLLDMGQHYQAKCIATNDVHYINPEDARLQDIMLAIQTGSVLSDPKRMRMTDTSYYLRSPAEMANIFGDVPEALSNTVLIGERCNIDLSFKGYRLPHFEVPIGHTPETYLRELCEAGLQQRLSAHASESKYRERLEYELGIIHKMGFDTYFLIVWDLCRYAREQSIWYNARGSAEGSIVAYTLDISLLDPLEHGLIFERFLNPGRISMPDIDLDFRDDRRVDMLVYTAQKYGDDKVAQIITFGTLGARAAIRDVGRVMDIPLSEVDKAAKLIPNVPGKPVSIKETLESVPDFKKLYESSTYYKDLIDTAALMEGVVRSAGTHAAGVIITDKPVIEYVPLHRPTGQSAETSPIKTVTQFEMDDVMSLGLLKVDYLGLDTLTIMARACDLIHQRHSINFTLNNIPTDDPETYDLLGRGETAGVFQVEGSGMRRWLMQMKPKILANVIAMVALFRPGPMDFIPGYVRRMHGEEKVEYRHPALEPIFKETFGYPVYQEQLMFAVMQLADYTPSEADDLRSAISKKVKEKLLKHREKFIKGAVKNGIQEITAAAIFDEWDEFARYGFNKAHAADYGLIAVQTAYLKRHYPVEYMTAVLSVKKNDIAKVALYTADCRRMGIPVEPPDINISGWDFTVEDCHKTITKEIKGKQIPGKTLSPLHAIRFGLGAIKNVGQAPVDAIIQERQVKPFTSINDFATRVDLRQVGKRALESLVKVGALDQLGSRPALLQSLDRIISASTSHFRAHEKGQFSMFGLHTGIVEEITLPHQVGEVNHREQLNWERELIGLYISDHPLNPVMEILTDAITHFSGQLSETEPNERVRVAGLITRVRPYQTKAGKPMGFVTIEDIQGVIELVVFPSIWEKSLALIEFDKIILVDGRVDSGSGEPKVLVDKITTDLKVYSQENTQPFLATGNLLDSNLGSNEDIPPSFSAATSPSNAGSGLESVHKNSIPSTNSPQDRRFDPIHFGWDIEEPQNSDPFPADWGIRGDILEAVSEPDISMALAKVSLDSSTDVPSIIDDVSELTPSTNKSDIALIELTSDGVMINANTHNKTAEVLRNHKPLATSTPILTNKSQSIIPVDNIADPLPVMNDDPLNLPIMPPYIVSPLTQVEGEQVYMITVMLRPTFDKVRDNVRIRQIYGTLITYPGKDRFAFQVFERGRGYLIEFPNFTTSYCPELISRMKTFISPENIRIDPITFQ